MKNERFFYQEAFRNLYTSIRFLDGSKKVKTILLSSSLPKEGKTLINIVLAKTIADLGVKVLLIDADMRKSQVHYRLGLNNHGSEIVSKRIEMSPPIGFLRINIGPNKDTDNKEEDYYLCMEKLSSLGNYITINISSPNTQGLRDFHDQKELEKLLTGINKIKKENNLSKPLALKLSPDIDDNEISKIVELIIKYRISGIIVSNSTEINRENLSDIKKNERGGLSGQPLRDRSTKLIKKFFNETQGKIEIIGVGGVDSGEAVFEKISAGANAVQLYTGMVFKGPGIVKDIKKDLISILKKENLKKIDEAIGISA